MGVTGTNSRGGRRGPKSLLIMEGSKWPEGCQTENQSSPGLPLSLMKCLSRCRITPKHYEFRRPALSGDQYRRILRRDAVGAHALGGLSRLLSRHIRVAG